MLGRVGIIIGSIITLSALFTMFLGAYQESVLKMIWMTGIVVMGLGYTQHITEIVVNTSR